MVEFNSWIEGAVLWGIFSVIIIVPCVLITLMGLKLVDQLGHYPSKTPVIHMSIFLKLVGLEILTVLSFWAFYNIFIR